MPLRSRRRTYVHQFKEMSRVDPYRSSSKFKGIAQCPQCSSICIRGRWTAPEKTVYAKPLDMISRSVVCPACQQLEDHFALGVVELHGEDWKEKRQLIMNTLRRSEEIAKLRNDQERILWIRDSKTATKIYVTLPELARRMGRTLARSFKGTVEYLRSSEEPYLRVKWHPRERAKAKPRRR